jgi:hypothetical protein
MDRLTDVRGTARRYPAVRRESVSSVFQARPEIYLSSSRNGRIQRQSARLFLSTSERIKNVSHCDAFYTSYLSGGLGYSETRHEGKDRNA